MQITKYHFHIYFDNEHLETLRSMLNKLSKSEDLKIGRVFTEPIGPHPMGSCQITVPSHQFETTLQWFLTYREGLTIFIHPLSGNDLLDHTDHVIWLGEPRKLNTGIFKESAKRSS